MFCSGQQLREVAAAQGDEILDGREICCQIAGDDRFVVSDPVAQYPGFSVPGSSHRRSQMRVEACGLGVLRAPGPTSSSLGNEEGQLGAHLIQATDEEGIGGGHGASESVEPPG